MREVVAKIHSVLCSPEALNAIGIFLVVPIMAAHVIWLLERRRHHGDLANRSRSAADRPMWVPAAAALAPRMVRLGICEQMLAMRLSSRTAMSLA